MANGVNSAASDLGLHYLLITFCGAVFLKSSRNCRIYAMLSVLIAEMERKLVHKIF